MGADHQYLFFAVKAQFDTETIRLWTGAEPLTVDGESYEGAGTLLSIGDIEDSMEVKSTNLTISLSGMDTTVMNLALSEDLQNRKIKLYMGYLMGGANESAGEMVMFSGRMTNVQISDDAENGATIAINAENRLVDLNRPSNLRYTNASQQILNSSDTGFKYVQAIQGKEILWGRPSNSDTNGGGSSDSSGHPRHNRR
jgi:hypothetical protein